ncbi:hypothetical protein [Gramella sp. AN32]|uniref:Uncharacterized protein n=1 Tax=Christiangramia antarctica TaxID=2058158 RepID=A0ABW5X4D5_9FLAO|nr:hypothetical protein [Gramella sp. AN32]MCM4156072.1 hypothetical protein [Gramella sp. AN32]
MKKLTLIIAAIFLGLSVKASVASTLTPNYSDSFIFVEGGVEFAIYPNGEFDFYFNPDFRRGNSVHIASPNVNISYNSGYNYEPYVQYDDYGAVIQIETVPVYYDFYGRIVQAGDILIGYNSLGYVTNVGRMRVHYDRFNHFTHQTGFINSYNRAYVYRPWHDYYRRPQVNVSIVFGRPYRAYYAPYRMSYHEHVNIYNNYYVTGKRNRNFYRPSQTVDHYNYGERTKTKYVDSRQNYSNTRRGVAENNMASQRHLSARSANQNRAYSDRITTGRSQSPQNSRGQVIQSRTESSTNASGRSTSNRTLQNRNETKKTVGRSSEVTGRNSSLTNRSSNNLSTARPSTSVEKNSYKAVRTPQRSTSSERSQNMTSTRTNKAATTQRSSVPNRMSTRTNTSNQRSSGNNKSIRTNSPSQRSSSTRTSETKANSRGKSTNNTSRSGSSARNMNI